uniref:Myb-like, SWIRM and MPN domain-containing protein 1 n=1 Tax=Hirondellea gigas TaxID=1518452 RepID=A0A6A7FU35_9CRUS
MSAVEEDLGGAALDIDVVGLPDIEEFKSEADLFDFDSGTEYGLFGEAGADLQPPGSSSNSCVCFSEPCNSKTATYFDDGTQQQLLLTAAAELQSCLLLEADVAVGSSAADARLHSAAGRNMSARPRLAIRSKRKSTWTLMEKDLFQKGLDLIGLNWNKLSRFISSKSPSQVRSYHRKWAETANVIQDSMEDFSVSYVIDPSTAGTDVNISHPLTIMQTVTTNLTATDAIPVPVVTAPMMIVKTNTRNKLMNDAGKNEQPSSKFTVTNSRHATDIGDECCLEFGSNNPARVSTVETGGVNVTPGTCEPFISPYDDWEVGSHVSVGGSDVNANTSVPLNESKTNRKLKTNAKKSKLKKESSDKLPILKPKKTKRKKCTVKDVNLLEVEVCAPMELNNQISDACDIRLRNIEGQVVRLCKDGSAEDSDVDIDVSDDEQLLIVDNDSRAVKTNQIPASNVTSSNCRIEGKLDIKAGKTVLEVDIIATLKTSSNVEKKEPLCFNILQPKEEFIFDLYEITDEEKLIHCEYFVNKGVKTPERYLKIRNAIIDVWRQNKPNYVGKTSARTSLKNCGDVNSIGKIHEYLEKKGAVNFGCSCAKYGDLFITPSVPKCRSANKLVDTRQLNRTNVTRQKRNKFRVGLTEGGGLTIRHDDSGAIVDACHIPEAPKHRKPNEKKSEQFKLVKCMEYGTKNGPAPFKVVLHPQAVATMDLHAHSSVAEVMGLVGGYRDFVNESVHITVAVPTQATSSGVECDMCPVSQSEACVRIQQCGVQVVGWYHSHPTFPPNPSVQDIESQSNMQQWFARQNTPFIGVILSPFCPTNRTESSHIQCLVLDQSIDKKSSVNCDNKSPFKLHWEVGEEKPPSKWTDLDKEVREVVSGGKEFGVAVEWRKEWKANLTYWEKAIRSLELLLPQHMGKFVQHVRQAFISAIKDQMDDR